MGETSRKTTHVARARVAQRRAPEARKLIDGYDLEDLEIGILV